MTKRMIVMLITVLVIFAAIGGYKGFQIYKGMQMMKAFANPPQTVSTTKAETQNWQPHINAVGSLRAVNGADLSFEVPGIIDEIDFQSGMDVTQGTVLMRLRSGDDAAKLESLKAVANLAQIVYDRDQKQFKAKAVAQATLDTDQNNLKNAQAQVDEQQAVLDKKILKAPFTGRLGIRLGDLGQYIGAGTTVVTLQALDPIFIDFYLPQQKLKKIKVGQSVDVAIDAYPDETFTGTISAINPLVAAGSRNMLVRATLKNPDLKLLPGMYATAEIATGAPEPHITLPQTAVSYNSYGNTVFLVDDKGAGADGKPQLVARQAFITTGETRGDQITVLNGIKDGDTVVSAGQMKLRAGTPLIVNNSVTPTNDQNPAPADQ